MITPTAVWVRWDRVAGSAGYDIFRDGVKVASTKTAVSAKLGVQAGGHRWLVRARPGGDEQVLEIRSDPGAPA